MTKSPALCAVIAAAACFAVDAQQGTGELISLRGFTPGAALTACPKGYQRTTLLPGKQNFVCGQLNASIRWAQAQIFSIDVFEGKIVRLGAYKIAPDGLDGLSEALALKFGTPIVSNKTKSTLTAEWNRGGVAMQFDVRPGNASLVAVDDARYDKYAALLDAARRAKNQSNL